MYYRPLLVIIWPTRYVLKQESTYTDRPQVLGHTVNSEYDHQAARAGNNNNTKLRVPKLNLPRLP